MSRKILAQQSDWAWGASSQGYIHNTWKKSWQMEDTLHLPVNTSNMESTIKNNSNNKMCHHIHIPGPGGRLKHKETDNFIEDTVIHWNNSVKSACREMAGYDLRKTTRFRDIFLNSALSVKEWLFCSDPKRWYFCGRDMYLYFYAICIFPTITGFKPLFWKFIIALNHEISYLHASCCKSWCERSVSKWYKYDDLKWTGRKKNELAMSRNIVFEKYTSLF